MPTAAVATIAGGSLISGALGAKSASDASKAQRQAAEAGIAEQARQFDITQEQLAPFREAGVSALEQQQALLGLSGPEAQAALFDQLVESPGQRFLRERQEKALLRNAAAVGGLGGGNVLTALQEQAAGFAQQDLQNQFARLGQLAGQGQATAVQLGQFGANRASNVANLLGQAGQARASGILGRNQAIQSGLSGLTSAIGALGFGQSPGLGSIGAGAAGLAF